MLGWLVEAKVPCILRRSGVQLILAFSWARPAVLAAGKGRGKMFLFLLFLHFHSFSFLPCPSFSSPLLNLLSLFSLSLGDDTKWPTRVDVTLSPNSINFIEIPVFKANSVDPDQTPRSAASDLGLHCLPMSLLWDTRHKYVNYIWNDNTTLRMKWQHKIFTTNWLKKTKWNKLTTEIPHRNSRQQ